MLEDALVISLVLGATAWFVHRRIAAGPALRWPSRTGSSVPPARSEQTASPHRPLDFARIDAANEAAADRLWRLAYAMHSGRKSSDRADQLVRGNVVAILDVDELNQKYFPRRPTLMSQLMQALKDPHTASDKISRMIAHDPVLATDVLRIANSSAYRVSEAPIETIPRAVAVCGIDALQAILARAMLRPVFRATSRNFPRLPRVLWSRTERAARAAELDALRNPPCDRFESSLAVLVRALGPLVVYSAIVDVYSRNPLFPANPAVCVALTRELAPRIASRIARDWRMSDRLVAALEKSADEPLTGTLLVGELLGTLSFLESQTAISHDQRIACLQDAALDHGQVEPIWAAIAR